MAVSCSRLALGIIASIFCSSLLSRAQQPRAPIIFTQAMNYGFEGSVQSAITERTEIHPDPRDLKHRVLSIVVIGGNYLKFDSAGSVVETGTVNKAGWKMFPKIMRKAG